MESPNAIARFAYQCSLWAIVPFFGLILGPAAVLIGIAGRWHERAQPSTRGSAQARAAMIIGGLASVTNWLGLYFLVRGSDNI
jgi:hypothetical protein